MTPQSFIDFAVQAADAIDAEQPTLRASGARAENLPVWLRAVARRANTLSGLTVFGLKSAGGGRPISYDAIGIRADSGGFYAVSLCRDWAVEGYPRRLIDYGLVGPEQVWYAVPPEAPPAPPPIPVPPVPPDLTLMLARLDALEAAVAHLQAEPVPEPCDPSQWEAAGRIAFWGVTLPLRHKR